MGLGITELLIMAAIVVLLFGPAVIIAWIAFTMGKSQASGSAAVPPSSAVAAESPETSAASDPAIDAARDRYARGEINRDEFEEIKHTLGY